RAAQGLGRTRYVRGHGFGFGAAHESLGGGSGHGRGCRDRLGLRGDGLRLRHRLLGRWQAARGRRDEVLVDPDLDTDGAEGRLGGGPPEVDIRAQRVERNAALAVVFAARHLGATQAASGVQPDALRTRAHGPQDGLLHRALVANASLDLARDVLGHELRVELGLLDLLDGDADAVAEALLEVLPQLVDAGAALADDDARLGGVDGDRELGVGRALGLDLGDAGVAQPRQD